MQDKTYKTAEVEQALSQKWSKEGFFKDSTNIEKPPFCIMMPPANVTGSLHMGHALTYTLQDILIRFNRMRGKNVLWQSGVDHAGIATQMVVERQLDQEGLKRSDLGREEFLERVWCWKEESGGIIVDQLKRLGASANWDRSRFTMDSAFNEAVNKCFVELFEKGLIYRDKRLVNWDIKLQTAISDLEVELREEKGTLWYIKYPLADNPDAFITVATTRPETLFGDTAVAVHKDDPRYSHLIGKKVILPFSNRLIPIVADDHCDPEKGSGAVKITPAHDFNDFQVGKRQGLEIINVLDSKGHLNSEVPEDYQNLDRFTARKKLLHNLEEKGFLEKTEEIIHSVPYGDRSGVVIEPWMTDQWFVNAEKLAIPTLEAIEKGKTKFIPERWKNVYFEWIRNIEPWCISRQIWWGHQIPAWHGPDGEIFVGTSEEEAFSKAKSYYGERDFELVRDTDVLDTWFSSALWPFVTLGWPEKTQDLENYYPTQVLVTGTDLIFFWVARMMMMGLYFMKDVPFKDVYMHPLVLDEKGQKMSKSKGNVINPLKLIDSYGADSLRFTITSLAAQGKNIKLSEKRVEGFRNFITKIWNVSRYLTLNECFYNKSFQPRDVKLGVNQWIVYKLMYLVQSVEEKLENYKFNEAAQDLYQFFWGVFCDWYIEFTKPILNSDERTAEQEEVRKCLSWCFVTLLRLLHPIVPFITDKLAQEFEKREEEDFSLSKESWPCFDEVEDFSRSAKDLDWVCSFVSQIRGFRSESNIPPKQILSVYIVGSDELVQKRVEIFKSLIKRLARLEDVHFSETLPSGCVQLIQDSIVVGIPVDGIIDIEKEKSRLSKALTILETELKGLNNKLENKTFISKAPNEIIQKQKERYNKTKSEIEKTQEALERFLTI